MCCFAIFIIVVYYEINSFRKRIIINGGESAVVSYAELIYHFTDIYLNSAVACSICKENYTMADDSDFWDEYMKLFVSLLFAVENDDSLSIDDVKETLLQRKNKKIFEFQSFLKQKIAEEAVEKVSKDILKRNISDSIDIYSTVVKDFIESVFDSESESIKDNPEKLLSYVRKKEEVLQERK